MNPVHDMGGTTAGPIDRHEHQNDFWEQRIDALQVLLSGSGGGREPVLTVDEMRRAIESLGPEAYESLSYYERWIGALTQILLERGVIDVDALARKLAEIEAREADT